jgi:hypothetical protein
MKILKVTHLQNGTIERSDFATEQECLDHKAYLESLGYDFVNTYSFEIETQANQLETISPRQIRLALLSLGITQENVKTLINALPSPTNEQALIAWEYSTFFERNAPLVEDLGNALGLTTEQLDALWIAAKDL